MLIIIVQYYYIALYDTKHIMKYLNDHLVILITVGK